MALIALLYGKESKSHNWNNFFKPKHFPFDLYFSEIVYGKHDLLIHHNLSTLLITTQLKQLINAMVPSESFHTNTRNIRQPQKPINRSLGKQAKQYIKEMAELTKRIRAAHLQGGGLNQHHHAQQAAAAVTVERYNPIGHQEDDPHMPKPLSVVVNSNLFVFVPS